MRHLSAVALLLLAVVAIHSAAPPGKTRYLTPREEAQLVAIRDRLNRHADAGDFAATAIVARELLDFRRSRQGARHWQTLDARAEADDWNRLSTVPKKDRADVVLAIVRNIQGRAVDKLGDYAEGERLRRLALQLRERVFGRNHPHTARSYIDVAANLQKQGKFADALPLCRQAVASAEQSLGTDDQLTATAYDTLASCLQRLGKTGEAMPHFRKALAIRWRVIGADHPDTAVSYNNLGVCLQNQARIADALAQYRESLVILERVLGPDHEDTASAINNVGHCLQELQKPSEALPLFRRALQVREKLLGKEHPRTAISSNNLAGCLKALGRGDEALPHFLATLRVRERVLGQDHPDTAVSYNNLASCLFERGAIAEALPLYQKALAIRVKVLGPQHPETAHSYGNLGVCLSAQGRVAEALTYHQKGLEANEKTLGTMHSATAGSLNSVASCLNSLGKSADALTLYRRALAIREKEVGPNHPDTALIYNNLATCLKAQGKHAEALPLLRKALAISEKAFGSDHPTTATYYNNLASCLSSLDKSDEALPLYRKSLAIRVRTQGPEHPDTVIGSYNLALCLWTCGRLREAVREWQRTVRDEEAARVLRADAGFERARGSSRQTHRSAMAVGLANLGQPRNAFAHAEASLARGLLDDLSEGQSLVPARAAELRHRMDRLEPTLAALSAADELDPARAERQRLAKEEYGRLWREWSELLVSSSSRAILPLERIQKTIPDDAAFVLWVEHLDQRWCCLLRRSGPPLWQRLADPTSADAGRAARLYLALRNPDSGDAERERLIGAFRECYFDPLRPRLKGVKRLFVVPAGMMAYIPTELLAEGFSVSYIPSGSVLARAAERHRPFDASTLLAVGDPTFDRTPPPEPPASGVLILSVLPGSAAAKVGLATGDVLRRIGSTGLESFDDLSGALEALPARAVVWREGKEFTVSLSAGPLGATFDRRSARAALRAWRKGRETAVQRGTGHKRLPGTRIEVEAIASMAKRSTLLLGSDASEQRLDELIGGSKLSGYRVLHFATHGEADMLRPERSALILAQDALPDPAEQVKAGKHPYDGRLTVSRIRERWTLDADLVVLSACETGLGKEAGGEGLLGFAQAFLSRGARSVVLSRWKVDDTATSLLMIRLYENLLGKRKGEKAMGRAASLDEAKKWLRTLPRKEAERLATLHTGGVLRGSEGTEKTPDKAKRVEYKGDTPFAHPYYWAAFTLIGDPD